MAASHDFAGKPSPTLRVKETCPPFERSTLGEEINGKTSLHGRLSRVS
jgi:hypothetical protein